MRVGSDDGIRTEILDGLTDGGSVIVRHSGPGIRIIRPSNMAAYSEVNGRERCSDRVSANQLEPWQRLHGRNVRTWVRRRSRLGVRLTLQAVNRGSSNGKIGTNVV